MKIGRIICLLILNFLSLAVMGAPTANEEINQAVENFVAKWTHDTTEENPVRAEYEIGKIDPRLNLDACSEPLTIKFQSNPFKQSKSTISVACSGLKPWKVFTRAKIKITRNVYVASRSLPRGEIISINDIKFKELPVNELRNGYFISTQYLLGMMIKRNINQGTPIQSRQLKAPLIISKGDDVMITAVSKSFKIRMKGKALSDGKLGQQIPIRNLKSKRIVRGTVIAKGLTQVIM